MHDRRIGETTFTFGNEGALFKGAMTWWDWETSSIWSQPWGAAISGELEGESLVLLPVEVLRYGNWKERHPETLVLVDERNATFAYGHQPAANTFVLGVDVGGEAVGFYFGSVAQAGVVNHAVGSHEIVAWADWESREGHIFLRAPRKLRDGAANAPSTLTFSASELARRIEDDQTGSVWDVETGVALSGPLAGNVLQRVPFISSFDWAWEDFYPSTEFFGHREDRVPSS